MLLIYPKGPGKPNYFSPLTSTRRYIIRERLIVTFLNLKLVIERRMRDEWPGRVEVIGGARRYV